MNGHPAAPVPHHRVGWFELFYDLVIVAAVSYTGHTFAESPSWALGAWIAAWTLIMFVLWLLTALNNNLFPGDRPTRRVLGLIQMLALVVAALGTVADEGLSNATGFVALAVAFATVSVMYLAPLPGSAADRRTSIILGGSSGLAALVLMFGVLLPDDAEWTLTGQPPWLLGIGVGIAAIPLFVVIGGHVAARLDDEHLGERLGQLVIIVLGEAFLGLVTALGGLPSIPSPLFFVLTFVVVFAIWTVYFSSVLPAGVPRAPGRLRAWLLGHWLFMFGAVGASAGFSALALVPFDREAPSEWTTLPLLYVMVALALLTWLSRGAVTRLVRVHVAAIVALAILTVIGLTLAPGGAGWEVAVGSVVVIADALVCVALERPYSAVSLPASDTPAEGSDPSPS